MGASLNLAGFVSTIWTILTGPDGVIVAAGFAAAAGVDVAPAAALAADAVGCGVVPAGAGALVAAAGGAAVGDGCSPPPHAARRGTPTIAVAPAASFKNLRREKDSVCVS